VLQEIKKITEEENIMRYADNLGQIQWRIFYTANKIPPKLVVANLLGVQTMLQLEIQIINASIIYPT
jgi:hypothetical protein